MKREQVTGDVELSGGSDDDDSADEDEPYAGGESTLDHGNRHHTKTAAEKRASVKMDRAPRRWAPSKAVGCFSALIVVIFLASMVASAMYKSSIHDSYWSLTEMKSIQASRDSLFPVVLPFHPVRKVLYLTLDGIPWHLVEEGNNPLYQLMHNSSYSKDMRVSQMDTISPAFSDGAWVSLLTGMEPEFFGSVGNGYKNIDEDNIIRVAQATQIMRAIIGDRFWPVEPLLDPFSGYGYVACKDKPHSRTQFDYLSTQVITSTLQQPNPYFLILSALVDTDNVAHVYGTQSHNFQSSLSNTTQLLQSILAASDNSTVILFAGDHGHIPPGGHGGSEKWVRQVPLAIYCKDSNINSSFIGEPPLASRPAAVYDLASTIMSLLGLAPPAMSQGVLISDSLPLLSETERLISFRQLWQQKQSYCSYYVQKVTGNTESALSQNDIPESESYDYTESLMWYSQQIQILDDLFKSTHSSEKHNQLIVSCTASVAISLVLFSCFLLVMWFHTEVDFISLFKTSVNSYLNRVSVALAFLCWGLFLLLAVPLYFVVWRFAFRPWGDSYENWKWTISLMNDSAYSAEKSLITFALCLVVALLFFQVFCRISQRHFGLFYLFRNYLSVFSCFVMLLLLSLAGAGHVYFAAIYAVTYIDPDLSNFQYRVDMIFLVVSPLCLLSVLSLCFSTDCQQSHTALWHMHTHKACYKNQAAASRTCCCGLCRVADECVFASCIASLRAVFVNWFCEAEPRRITQYSHL
ncbi:hypothetical protein Pelo_10046 [Pelomyxa schiedti]|nr:hypothetical protein Pelo_10046 [Pelomyxa schiedti]